MDISVEDKQKYLDWLSIEVDNRTENVVGGGHRHSYYKAAELMNWHEWYSDFYKPIVSILQIIYNTSII